MERAVCIMNTVLKFRKLRDLTAYQTTVSLQQQLFESFEKEEEDIPDQNVEVISAKIFLLLLVGYIACIISGNIVPQQKFSCWKISHLVLPLAQNRINY